MSTKKSAKKSASKAATNGKPEDLGICTSLSISLYEKERGWLVEAAAKEQMGISAWCRKTLLAAVKKESRPRRTGPKTKRRVVATSSS